MQRAVFFDRDGVINREMGDYVTQINDFHILADAIDCIKLAHEHGFKVIVITNQGGIDKGLYDENTLKEIHQKLINECVINGTTIEDIYYCRHHPIVGKCLCRKPESLMIEKAIAKYQLIPSQCIMIGDHQRDIDAAKKAGVFGLLVQPNEPKLHLLKEQIKNILSK
jgi:D-glycero-D-manno-heptose 1,7-bisphosphate phosphatase